MRNKRLKTVVLILVLFASFRPQPHVAHATTFTVINTNNSGAGSLRWAIEQANANPGPHTINFNLPALTSDGITIDGYFQPGTSPATDEDPALIYIELVGNLAGASSGIQISSANNTIRG